MWIRQKHSSIWHLIHQVILFNIIVFVNIKFFYEKKNDICIYTKLELNTIKYHLLFFKTITKNINLLFSLISDNFEQYIHTKKSKKQHNIMPQKSSKNMKICTPGSRLSLYISLLGFLLGISGILLGMFWEQIFNIILAKVSY